MPLFEQHCRECQKVLGDRFEQVHVWLDELFWRAGPRHRKFRHHKDGVETVRRIWGDKAAWAAELHILSDFPGLSRIPDSNDYASGQLALDLELATQEWERAQKEAKRRRHSHDK